MKFSNKAFFWFSNQLIIRTIFHHPPHVDSALFLWLIGIFSVSSSFTLVQTYSNSHIKSLCIFFFRFRIPRICLEFPSPFFPSIIFSLGFFSLSFPFLIYSIGRSGSCLESFKKLKHPENQILQCRTIAQRKSDLHQHTSFF